LNAGAVKTGKGSGSAVKEHVEAELTKAGWATPVIVDTAIGVKVNYGKNGCVLQVQTANLARAYYDLMKMQSLYDQRRAEVGVLVVPTAACATVMGDGLAQYERIKRELETVFFGQITLPIYLIGFEGEDAKS
jgi:hypothetical protein